MILRQERAAGTLLPEYDFMFLLQLLLEQTHCFRLLSISA
jgi:hypothetical protein